jgi:hypothetical protein
MGLFAITPSCTRFPQYATTFRVAASSMATVHALPFVPHQEAPACWDRPANQSASVAEKVPRSGGQHQRGDGKYLGER